MDNGEDEDDLKLVRASASLLSDLEAALPKVLWKPGKTSAQHGHVHKQVKQRDINYILRLIEPFQGEPQLLDSRLKHILPPIVDAYIEYLQLKRDSQPTAHLDTGSAICVILYTLCKVRGYKVIVGFLNNEPRYLEPILAKLEDVIHNAEEDSTDWQVPYVLLLWLSHLLLTPFDLASISNTPASKNDLDHLHLQHELPSIACRALRIGFHFLPTAIKSKDAAVMLLIRLVIRPDMQELGVADAVVSRCLSSLQDQSLDVPMTIYERLGPLRLLSGLSSSAELGHVIPSIYLACEKLSTDDDSSLNSDAIGKRLIVKTSRNVAILSLRSEDVQGPLQSFFETTNVLEDAIDYLLQSLGDRDSFVRYAAAKALSQIVLELDPAMGHEVIQAILDTFKEDMPTGGGRLDFRTANALKWHGLTLTMAHTLFKRSASPEQLPDIVNSLTSALQFEQRTATGSTVGTNVRDAANFGIWSLSRRYTTQELLSVDGREINVSDTSNGDRSMIQNIATQLILSACLDPIGNIRRGSSAALQELIGRHPNEVHDGIALVQIVDYQAVGLRKRAMVDVASQAAELQQTYWSALINGLLGWRGLRSPDVPSREAAATSLAKLSRSKFDTGNIVLLFVKDQLMRSSPNDVEELHGLALSFARLLDGLNEANATSKVTRKGEHDQSRELEFWDTLHILKQSFTTFSPRLLRSELPSATVQLIGALCRFQSSIKTCPEAAAGPPLDIIDSLADQLLGRHEETIQQAVPSCVRSLLALKRQFGALLGCIGAQTLSKRVASEGSKSTLHGACRAIALGALAFTYQNNLKGERAAHLIQTLANLTIAMNVDWRIVGIKALQLVIEAANDPNIIDEDMVESIVQAVHRGLNDYTIDERGDIGSLVRLQAIACTTSVLSNDETFDAESGVLQPLHSDLLRLSLEKLDRVRLEVARCQSRRVGNNTSIADIAKVSSYQYFCNILRPLTADEPSWIQKTLLEGCISCAGISAEPLLQASRSALVNVLNSATDEQLTDLMSIYASILKSALVEGAHSHPALELLAFLLDVRIPQRLTDTDFKWRNLLSTVQKFHHKSNDIPKILAAVHIYCCLAEIPAIREEVLKKLISMLKTNPYPRVRSSVAEVLFVVTRESSLKSRDWTQPASQHHDVIGKLQQLVDK